MTISDENTRFPLTINKIFKQQLEEIAVEEHRTLNNLIIFALKEYVKNREAD